MAGALSKQRALELLQELTVRNNFSSNQYEILMGEIDKYIDNSGIINNIKIEYTAVANTLKGFVERSFEDEQGSSNKFNFSWFSRLRMTYIYDENFTVKELAELFRQEIKNIKGQYVDIEHKRITMPSNPILRFLYLFSGNYTGKLLLALVTPTYVHQIDGKFKLDTKSNLTKLLLAIKAYQMDTNTIPNNINELVPSYISSIPKDPYDDKNLRYSKSDRVIYSVYSDMKDDKGDEEKDLCIKLNFFNRIHNSTR
jgi:hypothetical protein